MKKVLSLVLGISIVLALFACKKQETIVSKETVKETEIKVETTAKEVVKNVNIGQLTYIMSTEKRTSDIKKVIERNYGGTYNVNVKYYDTLDSALLALSRKDIDLVTSYDCVNRYIMNKNKDMYYVADTDVKNYFSIALPMEMPEWVSKINDAIDKLASDGVIEELKAKYIDTTDFAESDLPIDLPKIEGADTIKVLVTGDLPPLDFVTASGKPAGFNVALLSAISKEAKLNFELICSNTGSRQLMITSGKADAVFWARGILKSGASEIDFNDDLPMGLVVTTPYVKLNLQDLYLKQ